MSTQNVEIATFHVSVNTNVDISIFCIDAIKYKNPRRGRQHSFVEIDHEICSTCTVILSLPLIQEGQLSVSGERMCTILVNHLED